MQAKTTQHETTGLHCRASDCTERNRIGAMLQVRSLSLALSLFPWLALIRNVHPMGSVQCYSYEILSGWPRDTQPSIRALNDLIHLTCVYESRKRDLNNVSHFLFINIKYKYIFLHPHYSQFPIAYCLWIHISKRKTICQNLLSSRS